MTRRRLSALVASAAFGLWAPSAGAAMPAIGATGSITVTVVDAVTSTPIAFGCAEAWLSPSVPTPNGPLAASACAQGNGVVTLSGLTVGTLYYLHASSVAGYAGRWAGGTSWYDATAYSAGAAVAVALEKVVTVSGTVRHADLTAASDVKVAMTASGAGANASAVTAADGTWSVSAEPGVYYVSYTEQGYTTYAYGRRDGAAADAITVPARASTVIDDVLPTPTLVSGTVTDASTGLPVAGVCASVVRPDDTVDLTDGYGCTDSAGRYTLSPSSAGPWVVEVTDPGAVYAYQRGTAFNVAVGQQVSAPSIAMVKGATITGTIVDWTTGAPLSGVCAYAYAGSTGIFMPGQSATCSGVDGRWVTQGVHPGPVVVVSYGDDTHVTGFAPAATTQAAGQVFAATAAAGTDVGTVRLHKGAVLTGRITDPQGRPVVGASVGTVWTNDGLSHLPYPGPDWTRTQYGAVTDAQGRYTIARIDPMREAVVVTADGQPFAWQWSGDATDPAKAKQLTFAYDRTTRFDAELQPAASVSVTVKGSVGPGNLAAYTPSGAAVGWPVSYSGDGTYLITGLPRSSVLVAAGNGTQRTWFDHAAVIGAATPVAVRPGRTATVVLALP